MLSERQQKDKSFVVKKWAEIMDVKDRQIQRNMENNNRIHLQKFQIPIRADKGKNTVNELSKAF
jgi:hypothetical protein